MVRFLAASMLLLAAAISAHGRSKDFTADFRDSTLRVDFTLSGAIGERPSIAFSSLSKYSGWGGRRVNTASSLLAGNADALMTDAVSGDTLFIQPFSTLFQEWLCTDYTTGPQAMEGTVLLPYPRRKAKVSIRLRDNRRSETAKATLEVDPQEILIRDNTSRPPLPHNYIYRGDAPDSAKIRVAILAEGFTSDEMPAFLDKARQTVDAILDHEPFSSLAPNFDFIAVETPGEDSGVSVPLQGKWLDTPFKSHFSTFHSDRYLTTPAVYSLYDALTSLPAQHIIVLANTDVYGGGGIFNFYTLTTAGNPLFRPVVVHEFGHSFAGLADEYFYTDDLMDSTYPDGIEPWEPNITTLTDFSLKWENLVDSDEATLVEGAGYRPTGVWRASHDCRMRTNTATSFCPACRQAIRRMIEWLTTETICAED